MLELDFVNVFRTRRAANDHRDPDVLLHHRSYIIVVADGDGGGGGIHRSFRSCLSDRPSADRQSGVWRLFVIEVVRWLVVEAAPSGGGGY